MTPFFRVLNVFKSSEIAGFSVCIGEVWRLRDASASVGQGQRGQPGQKDHHRQETKTQKLYVQLFRNLLGFRHPAIEREKMRFYHFKLS